MRSRASIHASRMWRGLVLGATLAACVGPDGTMPSTVVDMRKQEIQDLWLQIREWRVAHDWSAEPAIRAPGASVREIRQCKEAREPSTETCQDICSIKDAICDNAQSICRIAAQLDGDAWADEKCKSAKASCKEATQKCCQCAAAEQPPAQPAHE